MSNDCKAKQFDARLETKVVNCSILAPRNLKAVSSLGMCIRKVTVLQNESEAHSFKVHKLL